MDKDLMDLIMNHIVKIETTLRQDIKDIKEELKLLRESQIRVAEVIVKLSSIEEKYLTQITVCKDARLEITSLKEKVGELEKRLAPLELYWEDFAHVKRRIVGWIIGAIFLNAIMVLVNYLR